MKKKIIKDVPTFATGLILCLLGWGCYSSPPVQQQADEIKLTKSSAQEDSATSEYKKKESKEALAIPIYSRSWAGKSGEAIATLSTKAGTNYTLERSSTDTPTQIIQFYQKLFPAAKVVKGETLWVISGKTPSGADFVVSALQPKGQKHTSITLSWTVLKVDPSEK